MKDRIVIDLSMNRQFIDMFSRRVDDDDTARGPMPSNACGAR